MKNVLVLVPLTEAQKARFEAIEGCRFHYLGDEQPTKEELREADIIFGFPRPAILKDAEHLEYLQLMSSGADAYVKPGVLRPGTVLASATGAYGQAVSEHAFALTLMLLKKLYLYRDDQSSGVWSDRGDVGSLRGATVLVVGLGDIGEQYAALVKAVGAYVIGVKRRASEKPACVDELCLTAELDSALPRADVVCTVLPGTNETLHLFNDERFAKMKPGALFVNCGRGAVVDGAALCRALQNGPLAAAASDVMEVEPLPADDPLWKQPNMVLTPHVAGGWHMAVTLERIVEIALYNLEAYLKGGQLKNLIDFETGYKK